ncbi:MAG: hypothetical protein KKF44_06395 [Nanoarchaeota archaeon]|nr:hypothetical protein [Nanoarchaeota archaeon]
MPKKKSNTALESLVDELVEVVKNTPRVTNAEHYKGDGKKISYITVSMAPQSSMAQIYLDGQSLIGVYSLGNDGGNPRDVHQDALEYLQTALFTDDVKYEYVTTPSEIGFHYFRPLSSKKRVQSLEQLNDLLNSDKKVARKGKHLGKIYIDNTLIRIETPDEFDSERQFRICIGEDLGFRIESQNKAYSVPFSLRQHIATHMKEHRSLSSETITSKGEITTVGFAYKGNT